MSFTKPIAYLSIFSLLAAFSVIEISSAQVDCADWNSEKFFKAATALDVTHCIQAGVDLNVRDGRGYFPLYYAVAYSNPDVLTSLLGAGADPNLRNMEGWTPLHWAVLLNENPDIVTVLLKHKADPYAQDVHGVTPLHILAATDRPDPATVAMLIKAGADPNSKTYNKENLWGSRFVLFRVGTGPKARDVYGEGVTPLHLLVRRHNPHPGIVTMLLKAGADPNIQDEDGHTPVHMAAQFNRDSAVIATLLDAGVDWSLTGNGGYTPLHMAAHYNEDLGVITRLLEDVADPDLRTTFFPLPTPLHSAARFNTNPAVVTDLLKAGADPNLKAYFLGIAGTPLHHAASGTHNPAVISALLEAGADPKAQNREGKIPWDFAKDNSAIKGTDVWWKLSDARF